MTHFANLIKKFLELDKFEFKNLIIEQDVIDNICKFAKKSYPLEFISFLRGRKVKENLEICSLVYQQYQSSRSSASTKINLPLITNIFGTVHSHPSLSNSPSTTDKRFFNKNFGIHLIISYPFSQKNIQAFNFKSEKINFRIKQKL